MKDPITEFCVACQKDETGKTLSIIKTSVPEPFYITGQAAGVSRLFRPSLQQATGWPSVLKKC